MSVTSLEARVLAAWLKICREDTGAGSLVALIGHAEPAVKYGTRRAAEDNVIVLQFLDGDYMEGSPPRKELFFRATTKVPPGAADSLDSALTDRLEAITTQPAFEAEGLDVSVKPGTRRNATELRADKGASTIQDFRLKVTI